MSTYAEKGFSNEPCNTCKHRWPNKYNPDMKVGDGCDRSECECRPDLAYCYERLEEETERE